MLVTLLDNDFVETHRLFGAFEKPFATEPQVGQEFIMVREDDYSVGARMATLREVYPNVNTGKPTYVFDYGQVVRGTARASEMARAIVAGNLYYSLYERK